MTIPTSNALSLKLDLPPIENHLYATVRGRRVKTKEARLYTEYVAQQVQAVQARERATGETVFVPRFPLGLTITLVPTYDRDVSGNKVLQDALAAALGFNDKLITRLVVEKILLPGRRAQIQPFCTITLENL
jgi:hypothetical protein